MKVSDIGQFGLIDRLAGLVEAAKDENAPAWQELILGMGDDCAAWHAHGVELAHVDAQIEGIHFRPEFGSWRELGWKALAVITSDIAAKGGTPTYALVSLTLPDDTEVETVTELYQGMLELAKEVGVVIVGGHISSAPLLTVTITVFGRAGEGILLRGTARVGDKIAVTGDLGGAAAYIEMLNQKLKFDEKTVKALKAAFLRPYPRIAEGKILLGEGIRTAMDISDGIMSDLGHILRASGVGARIEAECIPIQPEVKASFARQALELALGGGEDYELLFTGSGEAIRRAKAKMTILVTVIGEIIAEPVGVITVVDAQGKPVNLSRTGWDHFARR